MAKLNDVASGVVGGDLDVSEQPEAEGGQGTAVDAVMARKAQVRHRVEKLDELEREKRSRAETAPNAVVADPRE